MLTPQAAVAAEHVRDLRSQAAARRLARAARCCRQNTGAAARVGTGTRDWFRRGHLGRTDNYCRCM